MGTEARISRHNCHYWKPEALKATIFIAMEIKSSLTVKSSNFNSIRQLIRQNRVNISKAVVFYDGDSILSFGSEQKAPLLAIPLQVLGGIGKKG